MKTEIKFKLLDTITNKIITDSSHFDARVERDNGIGTVHVSREDVMVLIYTGFTIKDTGEDIYDGDLVDALVNMNGKIETVTDEVWLDNGVWRLGNFDGALHDYELVRRVGSSHEQPWPERPNVGAEQPA